MKFYSDEGLSLNYLETLYLSNPAIVAFCLKVSLSLPQFIEHNFFVQKV